MTKHAAELIVNLANDEYSISLFEIPEYLAAYKKCRAYLDKLQKEKEKRFINRLKKEGKYEDYKKNIYQALEQLEAEGIIQKS